MDALRDSTFDRARYHPSDYIFLPEQVSDNDRQAGQDDIRTNEIPGCLMTPKEIVDRQRHGP